MKMGLLLISDIVSVFDLSNLKELFRNVHIKISNIQSVVYVFVLDTHTLTGHLITIG